MSLVGNYCSRAMAVTATLWLRLAAMMTVSALVGCSNSQAPSSSLSLAATYHLRSIAGVPLPINNLGGVIDSGDVRRLGGDTIRIDRYSHAQPSGNGLPGTQIIAFGTWIGSQSGNFIVLTPLSANTVDTLCIALGDTLTRHTSSGIELYVAS